MLKWAVKQGYMERNPAESLTVKEDHVESQERDAYDKDDLQRLFSCPVYASPNTKEPEKFFIPLIALYGGLRLEEVCQLYCEDIKEIDGMLCIDINNDHDKSLKTPSSRRLVPIHPSLIDLGFLRYSKTLNGLRLWENLQKGWDGYGGAFGKWYQRVDRDFITKNRKRVFHSFRLTFINNLKQKEVPETVIAALVGHSLDSINHGHQCNRYNVGVLLDAINKLDYGIDLKDLGIWK
jgi:integrase